MGGGLVYVQVAMCCGRASSIGTGLSMWECDILSHGLGPGRYCGLKNTCVGSSTELEARTQTTLDYYAAGPSA